MKRKKIPAAKKGGFSFLSLPKHGRCEVYAPEKLLFYYKTSVKIHFRHGDAKFSFGSLEIHRNNYKKSPQFAFSLCCRISRDE